MLPPEWLLVPVTLAGESTLVVALLLLLPGLPSGEVAVAGLVRLVPAAIVGATATVSVKTELPSANEELEHEMVPLSPASGVVQTQPLTSVKETKVVPAGNGSTHEVLTAASGPLLFIVIV